MWENIKQWSGRIFATGGVVSVLGILWNVVFPIPGQIDDGLAWAAIAKQMGEHVTDPFSLFFAGTAITCLGLGTAKWWLEPISRLLSKKQDPPALPEPAEPERDYIYRTPEELIKEANFRHLTDATQKAPEIGKWLYFEGNIWAAPDTRNNPIEISMTSSGDGGMVILYFDNAAWRERLATLKARELIKGEGRITEISFACVDMRDCEIL